MPTTVFFFPRKIGQQVQKKWIARPILVMEFEIERSELSDNGDALAVGVPRDDV